MSIGQGVQKTQKALRIQIGDAPVDSSAQAAPLPTAVVGLMAFSRRGGPWGTGKGNLREGL